MSKLTRTLCCNHTPGVIPTYHHLRVNPCKCECHKRGRVKRSHKPTPASRPKWPRHADPKQQIECPLVILRGSKPTAPHVPTEKRRRQGFFRTGE